MSDLVFPRFVFRALGVLALLAWALHASPAKAGYSAIVIDADSGRVLAQNDPDALNYPASLTKMMTLYLTFKGLESGQLSLWQPFTVSAHAAAQAPSKLDLKPGSTVSLHDLIFAVITHSANDAAVVIGENIAGSEPAFAALMTFQARALGMTHTNFANASGLPNPDNVTTARDLATLALALYRDFPKEYPWFATEEFAYNGVSYVNHNHLMHSFPGMDGIKTGYIRASGFNLAASAVRDGHRLIAVVMGGESAHSRDLQMAALLNSAFAHDGTANAAVADDAAPAPDASQDEAQDSLANRAIAAISPVAKAEAATGDETQPARHVRRAKVIDGWSIQVGAYPEQDLAQRAAEQALQRVPAMKGRVVEVLPPAPSDKEQVFRARVVHFNHREAELACRELHKRHKSCAVIAPYAAQVATN
jgi:D-alanyl-D-alanine carboxypeptidase